MDGDWQKGWVKSEVQGLQASTRPMAEGCLTVPLILLTLALLQDQVHL